MSSIWVAEPDNKRGSLLKIRGKMKKVYLLLWCLLGVTALAAQSAFEEEEEISSTVLDRVQAQRVAFITEKLDITSKEAEKFWPLFNEYEREERQIRSRYQENQKRLVNMSDQEARDFILSRLDMEQELLDLKRRYFQRFAEVIAPRKLAGFNRADREFKRMLLNRIRANRRQGRN